MIATDAGGQETTSRPADLKVDTTRPRVRVQRFRNRLVQVTVSDPGERRRRDLGEGVLGRRQALQRAPHGVAPLPRPGPFRVTVSASDKAGNRVAAKRA